MNLGVLLPADVVVPPLPQKERVCCPKMLVVLLLLFPWWLLWSAGINRLVGRLTTLQEGAVVTVVLVPKGRNPEKVFLLEVIILLFQGWTLIDQEDNEEG